MRSFQTFQNTFIYLFLLFYAFDVECMDITNMDLITNQCYKGYKGGIKIKSWKISNYVFLASTSKFKLIFVTSGNTVTTTKRSVLSFPKYLKVKTKTKSSVRASQNLCQFEIRNFVWTEETTANNRRLLYLPQSGNYGILLPTVWKLCHSVEKRKIYSHAKFFSSN